MPKYMQGFQKGHKFFKGGEKGWFKKGHSIRIGMLHKDSTKKKISESKKGCAPWIKGKHHTEETKEKCRLKNLGKRYSIKTEFKKDSKPWNKGTRGVCKSWSKGKKLHYPVWNKSKHVKSSNSLNIWKKNGGIVWHKGKRLLQYSGINANHWKGGIASLTNRIRQSPENRQWVKKVFEKDNYVCQECYLRSGKGVKVYLEAHHVKQFSVIFQEFLKQYNQFSPIDDKETLVRLSISYKPFWNIENGITLCKECHNSIRIKNMEVLNGL